MKLLVDVSNGMNNPIHYCSHKGEKYYRKDYVEKLKAQLKIEQDKVSLLSRELLKTKEYRETSESLDELVGYIIKNS